jgi:hypothetical protein
MIVKPFKKTPKIPRIALVNDDGVYLDEKGRSFTSDSEQRFSLGDLVCYIIWDTAVSLIKEGRGEILRWNNTEIRWRGTKYPYEDYWKPRALDAGIIRFPLTINLSFEEILKQLIEFRDWLADEGAKPHCSFGSTSISLLRAKLNGELLTGRGASLPIEYTRGGRTLMGYGGSGKYEGQILQWDLPAAYASTLGSICYDGIWSIRTYNSAIKIFEHGAPVYCHAVVDIPNMPIGPLPEYLSRPDNPIDKAFRTAFGYPKNGKIVGTWTLNELLAAEEVGCKFHPLQCWTMLTGKQPFLPWWNAILRGRELQGKISRFLAKRTGNALWGMFCADQEAHSRKVIVSYENGKSKTRRVSFSVNSQKPGHDLAEAISGAVRAKLYQHIVAADTHLLCAHTDGLWVRGEYEIPSGWRIKQEAKRIDLLDPQTFRYYINSKESYVSMSGVPPKLAPEKFEERWERFEHPRASKSNVQNVQQTRRDKRGVYVTKTRDDL